MAKLTDRACANTKPHTHKDIHLGDGDGLYLRIRPGGTRAWMVDYVVNGIRRKITLGNYHSAGGKDQNIEELLEGGRMSLAQARLIAAEWKALRRVGRDPGQEWMESKAARKAAEEAESSQPTVRQAISHFMTRHMDGKKSAPATRYRLDRLAALIGDKKINEVNRKEFIEAIESIASGHREGKTAKQLAGEVLVTAKRLWRFAESRDWLVESCIERLKRSDFDARPRRREVALRLDELAQVWKAISDPTRCKADPVTIAALKILALTGQREREVCDAEWFEFDLEAGEWRLPAGRTKKTRANLVHLAPQAVEILNELKRITGDQRYAFASPLRDKQPIHGRSVNNALHAMFKRGHLPGITQCHVHDLRRTLITRLPDLGFEPFIGHKIANHVLPNVLAHYNHAEYLPERKRALHAWAERIVMLVNSSNVRMLKKSA